MEDEVFHRAWVRSGARRSVAGVYTMLGRVDKRSFDLARGRSLPDTRPVLAIS